jgi:hypothetical protein
VIAPGWTSSLRALKSYLELGPEAVLADREQGRSSRAVEFPSDR